MNAKEIDGVFHCDCGFSWSRGKNGSHNCADGLREKVQQLAAENVALNGALTGSAYISFIKANGWNTSASTVNGKFVNFADPEVDFGSMVFAHAKKLIEAVETPATDRIVAEAEARGVEKAIECIVQTITPNHETILKEFAQQLREGADK